MNTMDRKALKREYMETPKPMGVYRIHNTVNGKSLVGTSVNLTAMLNRHEAQLKMGLHANAALQSDWNVMGREAFQFEVLDTLTPPDRQGYDPADDLRTLEELWLERLKPFDERGYNKPARP
ncbi:MAG: GIY-YIG nuclease family protein [Bacteroidetes bacterium]|nr:GIY-YIG nuclease family protein [Bacteroidota bacterium]